jgi:hypothetical protein
VAFASHREVFVPPQIVMKALTSQSRKLHRPLLVPCSAPGCATLTMGGTCVDHDVPMVIDFPRGRPYRTTSSEVRLVDVAPA